MSEASHVAGRAGFAAAEPLPTASTDTAQGEAVHDSELFATYEDSVKKPFTADYFEVSNVWNREPTLARDLQEIEGYVRTQVEAKTVDNSVKGAREFIKELERKAGLTRYESTPKRIAKLLAYIDFRKTVDG